MKSMMLTLFLAAISTVCYAENKKSEFQVMSKEVECGPLVAILEILKSPDVDEKPIWIGKEQNKSNIVVLINTKTRAWTVIQYYKDDACVLGMGDRSEIVVPKR